METGRSIRYYIKPGIQNGGIILNQAENPVTGYIRVRVTNSGGNFPVEGATVSITDYNEENGELLYTLRTNSSGLTQTVAVPAVPIAESLTPGVDNPYTIYNIRVMKEGYYTAESIGVPVFEGIVSIQSFNLQPLTETDLRGGDRIIYEVVDAPGLQGVGYPNQNEGGNGGTQPIEPLEQTPENGGSPNE